MNKKLYFNIVFFIIGTFVVISMGTIIGMNFVKDSRLLSNTVMAQEAINQNPQSTLTPSKDKKVEGSITEGTSGTYVYVREKEPVKSTPKPNNSPTPTPQVPNLKPIDSNTPKTESPSPSPSPTTSPGSTPGSSNTPGSSATPGNTATPGGTPTPGSSTGGTTSTPQSTITQKVKVEVVNKSGKKDLAEIVRQKLESAGFEVSAGNDPTVSSVKTEIIIRKDNQEAQKVKNYINASKVSTQIEPNYRYDVTVIIGDDYN